MFPLFLQTTPAEPMMVPDSLHKAQFREAFAKLSNLDVQSLLENLAGEVIWISVKLIVALFFFIVGRWLIRRLVRIVDRAFESREVDLSLRSFLRNTLSIVLLLVLVLIVVQTLGVNVTSLIAVASAATLAIGMALSGSAQNFAGGVMLLVVKPYKVGDYITAQGQSGTVREIKLFSTVISTVDNRIIYIPNNTIATSIIDNYSTSPTRRIEWVISISYGDDVAVARKRILELLTADSRVKQDPAPVVWVKELADSSVCLSVRAWTDNDDLWDVYFTYNERFYEELPKVGIHFPFPQLDVHLTKQQ